jgi:hypothetical protein
MSGTELYGKNLTWGLVSGLGNNYEVNFLPYDIRDASRYLWSASGTQQLTEQVWKRAYNVLANCNNLIQEVEKKDTSFFTQKASEKNMILGEMYGIRAMLHFELLRIFSPAPVTGYAGATIPYVTTYPEYQPVRLNMQQIFASITTDMRKAQNMLANIDTVLLRNVMRSNTGRIRNAGSWVDIPQGDFFNYRGERMNYFAATSLLARIYLYKGDYDSANINSRIVYDYQKKNWFRWTSSSYQGQITDVDYIHTKRPDELLLCFSNNKNYENWITGLAPGGGEGGLNFRMNNNYMNELFKADLDDFRLVGWYNRYNDQRYLTWSRPKGNSYEADQVLQNQGPLLPVLRFSEMYHIQIECLIKQNKLTDAINMMNDLRTNRGAKTKISNSASGGDLMEILVKDIIRETLTEGQAFFMFKRLNRNIFNGTTDRVMKPEDWFAPLPQSEVAYQL